MLSNTWFGRRRFLKVFTLVAMAIRILHGTQLLEKNLKEDHLRNIPVKFDKNPVNTF